jgi:hypothetical protein
VRGRPGTENEGHPGGVPLKSLVPGVGYGRLRAITMRWTWFVPS